MSGPYQGIFPNAPKASDFPPSYLAQNRQPTIVAENVAMCIIAIAAVALRFYARKASKAGFWWDDWAVLLGLPYSLALNIFSAQFVRVGQGVHLVTILNANVDEYFKQLYFQFVIYAPSLVFFKISLLLFYVRVFPHHRWLRISSWILTAAILIWLVIVECLIIFQCNPIRRTWNRTVPGTCSDRGPIFIAQSIPTVGFDVIILTLAIPLIWKVQLPRTSRIALIGIFMMGGLVTVISIVRLHFALRTVSSDFTWNYVDLSLWSDTESPIGLLSVCLPTYGGLFRKLLVKLHIAKPTQSELTSHVRTQASEKRRWPTMSLSSTDDLESSAWSGEPESKESEGSVRIDHQPGFIVVTSDIKVVNKEEIGRESSFECLMETRQFQKAKGEVLKSS